LVFDADPLELAGRSGTRFSVDLPTAFGAAQIPEVRTVLARLFGNTGEMRIDIVPLDTRRILVSQFPPETTTELIEHIDRSEGEPATLDQWQASFTPQVFQ